MQGSTERKAGHCYRLLVTTLLRHEGRIEPQISHPHVEIIDTMKYDPDTKKCWMRWRVKATEQQANARLCLASCFQFEVPPSTSTLSRLLAELSSADLLRSNKNDKYFERTFTLFLATAEEARQRLREEGPEQLASEWLTVRLTTEFVRSVEMAVPMARLDDVMDEVPLVEQVEVETQVVPNRRVEKEVEEYETVVLERDEDPIDGEKEKKKDPFGGGVFNMESVEHKQHQEQWQQRQQQRLQQKQQHQERQQQRQQKQQQQGGQQQWEEQRQQQQQQQKHKQKERRQQWHELLHPKSQLQQEVPSSLTGFERLATVTRRIKIYEDILAGLAPTEREWISITQETLAELRKEERELYEGMRK